MVKVHEQPSIGTVILAPLHAMLQIFRVILAYANQVFEYYASVGRQCVCWGLVKYIHLDEHHTHTHTHHYTVLDIEIDEPPKSLSHENAQVYAVDQI